MLNSIHFINFKAFQDFNIALKDFNILTGPNNNGKSTILEVVQLAVTECYFQELNCDTFSQSNSIYLPGWTCLHLLALASSIVAFNHK